MMISEKFIHPQVTLAISTMLSLTVFLMSVDGGIPRTEEIPIISNLYKIQIQILEPHIPKGTKDPRP